MKVASITIKGLNGIPRHIYPEYMEFFAPTYIEVWLWLWREKAVPLEILFYEPRSKWYVFCGYNEMPFKDNPEEAIIAVIEYLVENDKIK